MLFHLYSDYLLISVLTLTVNTYHLSSLFSTGTVRKVRPHTIPEDMSDSEAEEDVDDVEAPPKRARRQESTEAVPERVWQQKADISYPPLPQYIHPAPHALRTPFQYFQDMFTTDLLEDIVYQTNLYARQKNVNTTFQIEKHELMVFIGILLYMGINILPSIEDYWATHTRVVQVAESMSSKRFRLIRSLLHNYWL